MHREYIRIVPGAEKAVLFIHGIVGTPNHFNGLIPLVPDHISVHNMLLDGHGGSVKNFSRTSMVKWENQVSSVLDRLSENHRDIYIVAHSLGCLLAIEQGVKRQNIRGLFLLAAPLKLFLKPAMVRNSFKVYTDRIDPGDGPALAAKQCYGIAQDKNILHYLGWTPRFLELFRKIRQTRRLIPLLRTPCTVYQSAKDEMVSLRSSVLLKANPNICVKELSNSGHFYYEPSDHSLLLEAFQGFCSNL